MKSRTFAAPKTSAVSRSSGVESVPRRFERAEDEGERCADKVYVLGQRDVDRESEDDADVRPPRQGVERLRKFGAEADAGQRIPQR